MNGLYAGRSWGWFLLFAPFVCVVTALLLPLSLLGLFMVIPGALGLIGLAALLAAWAGLLAPAFIRRARKRVEAGLAVGLAASLVGVLFASGGKPIKTSLVEVVALYALQAVVFLWGLAGLAPRANAAGAGSTRPALRVAAWIGLGVLAAIASIAVFLWIPLHR